ncbi:MAG: hypothetical protein AABY32_04020 [Nanoarchaeota archaeon]
MFKKVKTQEELYEEMIKEECLGFFRKALKEGNLEDLQFFYKSLEKTAKKFNLFDLVDYAKIRRLWTAKKLFEDDQKKGEIDEKSI